MNTRPQINIKLSVPLFLIGVILLILKLGEVAPVADWSWWLVTLPFWIGFVILGLFLIGFILFLLVIAILASWR